MFNEFKRLDVNTEKLLNWRCFSNDLKHKVTNARKRDFFDTKAQRHEVFYKTKMLINGKCFQPFELIELIERIEPLKPNKPHKPLQPLPTSTCYPILLF